MKILNFLLIFILNILFNINLYLLNRCNQLIRITNAQIASHVAWNMDKFVFYRFSINNHFSNIIISLHMPPMRVCSFSFRMKCSILLHFNDIDCEVKKRADSETTCQIEFLLTVFADFLPLIVDAGGMRWILICVLQQSIYDVVFGVLMFQWSRSADSVVSRYIRKPIGKAIYWEWKFIVDCLRFLICDSLKKKKLSFHLGVNN